MIIHSKTDNIELMVNDKANEIIEKRLNHFLKNHGINLNRYQVGMETSM